MTSSIVVRIDISGTTFNLDVTPLELSASLSTLDYEVTHNGVIASGSYSKTSQTQLSYAGVNVSLGTKIIARRVTSVVQSETTFISTTTASALTNALDKLRLRNDELDARLTYVLSQVLVGGITIGSIPINNGTYPTGWSGDSTTAPSRNALINIISTLSASASPTFTGDPKAPTPATGDNDTSIATTAFVTANKTKVYSTVNNVTGVGISSGTVLANLSAVSLAVGDIVVAFTRATVQNTVGSVQRIDSTLETNIPGVLSSAIALNGIPASTYATVVNIHYGIATTAGTYTTQCTLSSPGGGVVVTASASNITLVIKP